MKLENNLNIDIVDDKPPEPVLEQSKKDILLADVPLDDSASEGEPDIDFVVKPKPDTTDIFDDEPSAVSQAAPAPAPAPVEPAPPPAPVVKVVKEDIPTKPTKKKRKPMSDEHKAKLEISRQKAVARRKYLAEQRKIEKQQAQLLKDQEQLLHQKQMDKKLKELQDRAASLQEPSPSPTPTPTPTPKPVEKKTSLQGFSMEDLEKVQLNAIMSYEVVRKKRKEEKKKKQSEDKVKNDIMNTIKKAQPSWYVDNSPYNGMF